MSVNGLIVAVSSRLLRTTIASKISFMNARAREGRIDFLLFFFTKERKPLFSHARERESIRLILFFFFLYLSCFWVYSQF